MRVNVAINNDNYIYLVFQILNDRSLPLEHVTLDIKLMKYFSILLKTNLAVK